MQPLLCVTVTARTMGELRQRRDAADGADLVELRLDGVERPDPAAAIDGRRKPVVVTCRARWEGGHFDGSEDERRRILMAALDAGAEFVDVEAAAEFTPDLIAARGGRGIVASIHDFDGTPPDLRDRYRRLRALGAEVAKLAVTAASLTDSLALFELSTRGRRSLAAAMC